MSATTQTEPPTLKTDTGLTASTHSSTSSAERYRLDEFDTNPILLYKYRGGLQTSSQKDLCAWLDKDENFRVTKKSIPRLCSYIDVKRHDLYLPEEKEQYSSLPNFDSSLASVKIPSQAYWSRLFLGGYDNLFIVSPETSPNSSVASGDSKRSSPTSTWGQNSEEDARTGAAQDAQQSQ
ncbi:hypothetical protein M409DRAFT_61934 [Zasmidium cellare ATCC 36951]|uniref:Uncharacterized protein n=1 Tax=Zasmidium cellare ATCC 36951 TaxID=1080233 RepID=A0A6A6D2F4_ZASCE|nr:uncharacterized protein M409DRAFT_61934 [Zasmidium cellare ATCC 36951]KAF2173587.1 hypothetical protein M409DRAFT_61934 [Zasmidium cellare ATCC 36951]